MRTPPPSPQREQDVVEHSGRREWHLDLAGFHATNFHVDSDSVTGADGSYVVYDIEIVLPSWLDAGHATTAAQAAPTVERLQKRWSQVEALHTELMEELPHLSWREIAFPRKWVKTLDEGDIEKRLRDMNGYFRALLQLLTKSRTNLRPTLAFGRFVAEPASHRATNEGRHTAQQLAEIRAQSESDASDAAELKEAARLAAERIVKADITKAQQAGLDYEAFRSEYRPVGGDASLHKLWEQLHFEQKAGAVVEAGIGRGTNEGSSSWGALDLSRPALSCEVMDPTDAPKRVVVSCYVNDILKIDVVEETFTPLLSFTLDWTDDGAIERTQGSGSGWALTVDEAELWRPFMDFENLVEKVDSLDDTVGVFTQQGRPIINQFRRHINVLRPHKLELRDFPFDTLQLDVGLSFGWDSTELQIVPGVTEAAEIVQSSPEYILTGLTAVVSHRRYGYFEQYDKSSSYPHMTVTIQLARRPFYYIVRLVGTLCAITCMEYTSFLLEPSALSDRFGVSSSVVLAAIGIHYTAAENLPKISYLTRLDKYMFLCYVLIFVSFIENIVAFKVNQGLPSGPRDTTNAALMACYASWWPVCDVDSLSSTEDTLALGYVGCVLSATLWFNWPLMAYYRRIAQVEKQRPQSQPNEKVKAE